MKNISYEWTDHWQRKFFALFVALCIWLATRESLMTTRTFLDVPVRVINISPEWTINNLSQDGLMPSTAGLVLHGKKVGLNQMLENRLEVVVDASGHTGPWVEKINANHLRSTARIDVSQTIKKVSVGEISIPLCAAVHDKVPLIYQTKGSIEDGNFQMIDYFPKSDQQSVFGPEETIVELKKQRLQGEIDLAQVDCQQLNWQQKRSRENLQYEEITYPYIHPISCSPVLPPNQSPTIPPQSLQKIPRLYFLSAQNQVLRGDLPLFIQGGSKTIDTDTIEEFLGGKVVQRGAKWRYLGDLEIRGVSGVFANLLFDQSAIQLTCRSEDNKNAPKWTWHLNRTQTLADRYVTKMRQENTDSSDLPEYVLRRRFWYFTKKMVLLTKSPVQSIILSDRRHNNW